MIMVHLHHWIGISCLADVFVISSSTASHIFNTWTNFLENELPQYLLKWQSKEQIQMTYEPHSLKYLFKYLIVIWTSALQGPCTILMHRRDLEKIMV
ncbi:hypothetical protein LSH36_816g00144 [Paralvinella palmiformis]|uniref:Transposase Helix-turn-helix domain-containing protein n=1 Tax=Paralvinella palmiformis TaxID=53620 RepID=A0AAD9IZB6_9ANNE|nr:hypothetical protein LSH36_816g00144 [Paralvinella palmiformis]